MSKQSPGLQMTIRIVFLVLMGVITLYLQLLFLIIFVPVIGWYVWRLVDRNAELEKRVAALEGKKPDEP